MDGAERPTSPSDPKAREQLFELPPEDLGPVRSVDGTELALRAAGNPSRPVIVFVHGFSLDMTTWHYQWTELSESYRCILFDFRSHGLSARAGGGELSPLTSLIKAGPHNITAPIYPKPGDTYVGEYGAILVGSGWQTSEGVGASTGTARNISDVTIRNLASRIMPQFGIATAYAANDHWTIDHNEMSGARIGLSFPDYSTVTDNFIHHNGQFGFNGYRTTGFPWLRTTRSPTTSCACAIRAMVALRSSWAQRTIA